MKLENLRAFGKDEAIQLAMALNFLLEQDLEFIADDELVDVNQKSIRLRKKVFNRNGRERYKRNKVLFA